MTGYYRRGKGNAERWDPKTMFGSGMSFAASEAYKLLRTNIMFSLSDAPDNCRVIGITSSVQDEGKSSSVCNIAYALTEAGASVLLLEADLRRPTLAEKMGLSKMPGLTNLLVSRDSYKDFVQHSSMAPAIDIIIAGDIPPNPSELLGSERMLHLIESLRQEYEYILIDLPPVTAVSDAAAVSKNLDGVIVIVRSGVAQRKALAETMRQLKMVGVRILGFVYREDMENRNRYKKAYKRYSAYEKTTEK